MHDFCERDGLGTNLCRSGRLDQLGNLVVVRLLVVALRAACLRRLRRLVLLRKALELRHRVGAELVQDVGHELGEVLVHPAAVDRVDVRASGGVDCGVEARSEALRESAQGVQSEDAEERDGPVGRWKLRTAPPFVNMLTSSTAANEQGIAQGAKQDPSQPLLSSPQDHRIEPPARDTPLGSREAGPKRTASRLDVELLELRLELLVIERGDRLGSDLATDGLLGAACGWDRARRASMSVHPQQTSDTTRPVPGPLPLLFAGRRWMRTRGRREAAGARAHRA